MMANKPYHGCKYLNYDETRFPDCTLKTQESSDGETYHWWHRNVLPYPEAPVKVQFCKLRGRINKMSLCWDPGDQSCWTPQDQE